jgi:hypothetical protein
MNLLEQLALRVALRYLESIVTPGTVDEALDQVIKALKGVVAKTETKIDDKLLEVLLRVTSEGNIGKAIEAELVKLADALVAGTETKIDDQVWGVIKKALEGK